MKLVKVTLTGADDSVRVEDLLPISERFPFVEWGILVSERSMGSTRFPSLGWLRHLDGWNRVTRVRPFNLSCHVCGKWVRDICLGKWSVLDALPFFLRTFNRVQLNFHGHPHKVQNEAFIENLKKVLDWDVKQFIFQYENVNNHLLALATAEGINCAPLFDLSGGAGVLPEQWPKAFPPMCGYAGGLSPDNLQQQLELIDKVAGDVPIWIDAETLVRSEDNRQFDLAKVTKFLEVAEPWIQ